MKIFSAGNFNNDWWRPVGNRSATGQRPDQTSSFLKNLICTYLCTVRRALDRILQLHFPIHYLYYKVKLAKLQSQLGPVRQDPP